jgi:hypothetical protein
MKRNIVGSLLLVFACLSFGLARADDGQPTPQVLWVHESPSALTVSLEANGSTFTAGQAVLVRITLSNHSSVGILENFINAEYMFALKVTDRHGSALNPNITPVQRAAATYSGRPGALLPGDTFVVTGETQDRYTNLQAWGYDLNQPGDYRITAYQKFGNGAEVDSNPITIVIH